MRPLSTALLLLALATAGCDSDTATCPDGDLQTTDVTVGTGQTATLGSTVTIAYVGTLADGTEFDRSATYTQPLRAFVPGFRDGVVGMRIGGRRTIVIPPNLAYGATPPPGSAIQECSTLTFDVTLLDLR